MSSGLVNLGNVTLPQLQPFATSFYCKTMRYVGAIAIVVALSLSVASFTQFNDLQDSIVSLTSGSVANLVNTLGAMWMIVVGLLGVVALGGALAIWNGNK